MTFIEKNNQSLARSVLESRVSIAREAYDQVLQMALRELSERLIDTFTDEFDTEPHSSWFTKREFPQFATGTIRIEMSIMLPRRGDVVLVEGERIQLPVTVHDHSSVPVKVPGPFSEEAMENYVFPITVYSSRHIGWDTDSGLMVFGRES